jgi:hypothetical protein
MSGPIMNWHIRRRLYFDTVKCRSVAVAASVRKEGTAGSIAEFHVPLAPVLHIFGSRSGISHLLHAPIANPSEIAIRTVQIFRMRATPAETECGKFFRMRRPAASG